MSPPTLSEEQIQEAMRLVVAYASNVGPLYTELPEDVREHYSKRTSEALAALEAHLRSKG